MMAELIIDLDAKTVFHGERRCKHLETEAIFDLLVFFCQHPNQSHYKTDLIEKIWYGKRGRYASIRSVDQVVVRIRKELGKKCIETKPMGFNKSGAYAWVKKDYKIIVHRVETKGMELRYYVDSEDRLVRPVYLLSDDERLDNEMYCTSTQEAEAKLIEKLEPHYEKYSNS